MSQELVIDILQNAILTVIAVGAPPLVIGLTVGILVSIFQAVTSIQEPTMAFVPKIIAVLFSIIFFGYFMVNSLQEFTIALFETIPGVIHSVGQ
ncbi:MAG: flagellar biosynthesis protein FliQ [Defluviitaleaceae bacterium]|nr:flagellar biosynthesis protein FliQ [Defluviitaleaceae bacterium]